MRFTPAGDQSLLLTLGDAISLEIHLMIRRLVFSLQSSPIPHSRNLNPAYTSILVTFDPLATDHAAVEHALRNRLQSLDLIDLPPPHRIEIPVCYTHPEFAPDLSELAELHALTPGQVIDGHSSADYLVYFLGFVPNFAYLGGLPEILATPRLPTPRRRVEPGSVAIGGAQTGVYPVSTPGGWRIIGRTPELPALTLGDHVRFRPITMKEYLECWK